MQRRKFSREFKLEAVRLVRERGVAVAQAARDLDVHENVLRKWVKEFASDPGHAFPGHGQVKPEQLEIDRLRPEVAKLKAERDILKKSRRLLREGLDMRFAFIAKHRGIWPVAWMCGALGVSRSGFHAWLTWAPSQRARDDEVIGSRIRASHIGSYRTYGARRVWHDLLAEGISCVACIGSNGSCGYRVCGHGPAVADCPRIRANARSSPAMCWIASSRQTDPTRRGGLHLHLDCRGVALRGSGDRPVLAQAGGLVDERYHDRPARHGCADHGDLETRQARCLAASLGPEQPIYQ